jgi:16S rRNA (cytosine1402-N4)-methyltransferase
MPSEAITGLKVKRDGTYIDCTLGGGGHTLEIIKKGGIVLGIDQDSDALKHFRAKLSFTNNKAVEGENLFLANGNFKDIDKIAKEFNFSLVDGIIYDLGVSTHQLREKERGFSFGTDAKLDMRMDLNACLSAKEVVNTKPAKELYEIFTKYGEEKRAWSIANAIVRARLVKEIETTTELALLIEQVRGRSKNSFDRTHPATRVFQSLRIYVNEELDCLKESLPKALNLIRKNGRLVVISFHSLEDRIVKNFIKRKEDERVLENITKKPIRPSLFEIEKNKSSRSGKLRVAQKLI